MSDQNKEKDFDDRDLTSSEENGVLPKPQIEIIVDGNTVFKPGMKTFFVDEFDKDKGSFSTRVMGEYCSCDTVTAAYTVCTCEDVCTCHGYSRQSTTPTIPNIPTPGTPQVSVPTTTQVCSCQSVTCGGPCACVPVH